MTDHSLDSHRDLHHWLEEVENNLDHFRTSYNQAVWQRIVEGNGNEARSWQEKQYNLLLCEELWQKIAFYLPQQLPPTLARRLSLLQQLVRRTQIATDDQVISTRSEINRHISHYPLEVKNRRVSNTELFDILIQEPDAELREAAWRSKTELGKTIEPLVRKLIQRRNHLAQEQGYKNYFEFFLFQSGLDADWVSELLAELEQASTQPYLDFLTQAADRAGLNEIRPWDILYLVEQEMALPPALFPPERVLPLFRRLTSELGFDRRAQELDIHVQDLPYNALTFIISVPQIVKVISNPSPGYRYHRILFHEFGHALAARYNEQPNYLYKWEEAPCFNEGLGQIMTHFTIYPAWQREHVGLPEELLRDFAKRETTVNVYRYRDWLAMAAFEKTLYYDPERDLQTPRTRRAKRGRLATLYYDPERDLQTLWQENYQRFYRTSHPDMPSWAEIPYYINYPFHFLNCIVADVISFQIHAYLRANFLTGSNFASPHVASFLIENFYAPSCSIEWKKRIQRATEKKLSWQDMIASFYQPE